MNSAAGRSRSRQQRGRKAPSGWTLTKALPWSLALAAVVVVALVILVTRGDRGAEPGAAGAEVERFTHLHGLAIPAWAPDTVYVSTHQGLIRIGDGGDGEWRYVSEHPHDFMGFAVDPETEDALFTSGHPALDSGLENPLGLLVSTDAGHSWEVRSLHGEVDFHAMAVDTASGEVIYGFDVTGGRLLASSDTGHTWDTRTLPHPQGALALAVHPSDAETVLAATVEGLQVSRDGGRTWESLLADEPATAVTFDPGDGERILAYVAAAGGGLLESRDAGSSWRPLELDVGDDAAGHLAVHPADSEVVYVGTHGAAIHRSSDGGDTWEQLASDGVPTAAAGR